MAKTRQITDPRQASFIKTYYSPDSPTYGNAYKSALNAGYSDEYASTITAKAPDWMAEISRELVTVDEIVGGVKQIATKRKAKDSDRLRAYELLGKHKKVWGDSVITADNITISLGKALNE